MNIITRFAPSPTGFLHIGSARTAIFNYLFAKRHSGKFLLRIEDTDKVRSTEEATQAILDSMKWLELDHDSEIVYQSKNIKRHQEIAYELLKKDKAYYCYQTQEETDRLREEAKANGQVYQYDRKWRDSDLAPPNNVKPVIRLKANYIGETVINDIVQGEVIFPNSQIDDMVLLRSDGTPTYMLSVVVDDHDMNITHIIRGDDHLNNAARQVQIYDAMGWEIPAWAHIPLIHGSDGAKLSKRHGALGVEAYKDMGYLPEALNNYLLRLGWSHGDSEIISKNDAISWFNLDSIGKSPSRIDFKKLENVNAHYIKESENSRLVNLIIDKIEEKFQIKIDQSKSDILLQAMDELKVRAKNINELAESALFYVKHPIIDEKMKSLIDYDLLERIDRLFENLKNWNKDVEQIIKNFVSDNNLQFSQIGQMLRIILTGTKNAPNIFSIIKILGKKEVLNRIRSIN